MRLLFSISSGDPAVCFEALDPPAGPAEVFAVFDDDEDGPPAWLEGPLTVEVGDGGLPFIWLLLLASPNELCMSSACLLFCS